MLNNIEQEKRIKQLEYTIERLKQIIESQSETSKVLLKRLFHLSSNYQDKGFDFDKMIKEFKDFHKDFIDTNLEVPKQVYTYVLEDKANNLYKIGITTRLDQRLKQFQHANPNSDYYFIFEGNYEKELHERYKDQRIKGEWFWLYESELVDLKLYLENKRVCIYQ